jgi:integrase
MPSQPPWNILKISRASYYRHLKKESQASLIDEFIRWKELGVQEKCWSHLHKRNVLLQIKKYFRVLPFVTPVGVVWWVTQVSPERHSCRKDRHAALSMFSKFLNNTSRLSEEDYRAIRSSYPKKSPYFRPKQKVISTEQLILILASTEETDKQVYWSIVFLSETGLRLAEFCNLKKEHVYPSDNPVESRIFVDMGKGGRSRWVPFNKASQEAYKGLAGAYPKYRGIMDKFRRLSDTTGVEFSAHSLRHYRITQWANNPRIPIATVQKWAGHSSLEVTQKYIHISDDEAMRVVFG